MQRSETIAVRVHKGEQPRLDELRVVLRGLAKRLEDYPRGQPRWPLQLQAIKVLEPRVFAGVEPADVCAPPRFVRLARQRQALVGVERRVPAVAMPSRLTMDTRLPQGYRS